MDLQDLISQMGYRQDSPFLGNPYNDIHTPDGSIDMSETPFDLWGTDEHGNKKKMKAFSKKKYKFPGKIIREIPVAQKGGSALKKGGLTKQQIYDYLFKESSIPNYEDEDVPEEETTQQEPQKVIETDLVKEKQKENQEYEQAIALAMGDDYNPGSSVLAGGTGLAMNMKPLYQNTTGNYTQSSGEPVANTGDTGMYAFTYLQQKHDLPPHVAAGITGNFDQESGKFRQDVIDDRIKGDNGASHGVAQWQGQRWTNLQKWAGSQGRSPFELETQLDFAIHEAKQRGDLDKVMKTKTSEEAAYQWAKHFERPAIIDKNRAKFAKRYHPYKYGGIYDEILNEL